MKPFIGTFICCTFVICAMAQTGNVGIGINTPTARLQINHTNTPGSPSLILFDSTAGTGSTLQFKKQNQGNSFSLVSNIDVFSVNSSLDIRTTFNSGILLRGDGRVGINNVSPEATLHIGGGVKVQDTLTVGGDINVRSKIKLNGNAGAAGEVLTSNGAGVAPTWEISANSSAYSGAGRFWITPANNNRSTGTTSGRGGWNLDGAASETAQEDSLDYLNSNETGSDFTINNPGLVNNYITVNRTGLYHFEGALRFFVTANMNVAMLPRATLNFLANQPTSTDLNLILIEDPMDKTGGVETGNSTNTFNYTAKFSINIHLQANSTVTFKTGFNLLRYPSAIDLIAMGVSQGGYVSGHFIAE